MSNYETTQKKRDITVGVFVVIAICALVWLIYKFGDLPTSVSRWRSFQVFVQFPTAPGVQRDTPVRFAGYRIGMVTEVMPPQIREDLNTHLKYHQTLVVLSIDKKYVDIPSNVEVKLMTKGLGSSYIELKVDPEEPLVPLDPNRHETIYLVDKLLLQGSAGMTSEFFPEESQKKLDELADGLLVLIKNANDIIGDKDNKENLKSTLANLSKISQQATEALDKFKEFSDIGIRISEDFGRTVSQMRMILEKINTGQGSAAKFINDGRLYENLLENTNQLEILLEELKTFMAKANEKGIKIQW